MRLRIGQALAAAAVLTLSACAPYRPVPLGTAAAPVAVPAIPLDLNAIGGLAVGGNPELRALRVRAGVADAQLFAARLLPDPTATAGFDKILSGPDTTTALASQLLIDIAALRTRHVVLAGARAAGRQVRLDLAWAEWQTAGAARLQAVRVEALQRAQILNHASATAANALLMSVERAAARGDIGAGEVETRRLAALDAGDRERAGATALSTAQFELARLLGLPPGTPVLLVATPVAPPPSDAARLFALAQDRRFDFAALRAGYDVQEAAVHKAVLDQFPTLTLALNGLRDTTGNRTIGPSVGFTLPLWNRGRGGIRIAEATRSALHAEFEARLFQAHADIAAAVAGIAIRRAQAEALRAAQPEIDRIAVASTRAAARGDLAPATTATAQQAQRDKALALIDTEQQIAEAMVTLELLTGTPREDWNR